MTIAFKSRFHHPFCKYSLLTLLLAACGGTTGPDQNPQQEPDTSEPTPPGVEIRYTEYGIPHVRAANYRDLGFGQGYAQARDNLCKIQLGMLGFRGEFSRYFGADGPPSSLNFTSPSSEISDLYFKGIVTGRVVEQLVSKPAPLGPREEVREAVRGYVAGFNQFLAEKPAVECADQEWVVPMTEMDVYRRVYAVTTLMDQGGIHAPGVAMAEPPISSEEARLHSDGSDQRLAKADELYDPAARPGSNAVAIGGDISRSGGGISLANPHLRWSMDMRWSVGQLTIPGELDVAGASLIGVPFVVMGHTKSVGWGITTAEPTRHAVIYDLTLADDSPTTYLVDGKREAMEPREVSIEVKRPDGSIETVTRTQWLTRFGPVLGAGAIFPLPWSAATSEGPGHAYVLADANASNMRMLNTMFAFNHASSSREILDAIRETQGVPWWSVLAADAEGEALLSQIQVVPNVPDDMLESCSTEFGKILFGAERFAILDGSRADCVLGTDDDALEPGIFGPGDDANPRMPFTLTRNYAENSNDSYWLPNADDRIDGMPQLLGQENTERGLRTRGLIAEIEAQKARSPYTRQILSDAMLSNRSYAADLVLDESVALCRALPEGKATATDGASIDISGACDVLASFNHIMDSDSPGARLFASFWVKVNDASEDAETSLWKVLFNPADPVNTPHTLDTENPLIAQALADAVQELEASGTALNATLADYQYVVRNGERFPIGGGTDDLAVMNAITLNEPGTDPSNGSGYMHVVGFSDSECPDAVTLVTYSQSSEPSSPHYSDQTALFADKQWVTGRFCEADIAAATVETIRLDPTR
jgi:acyl-homoserine-lactone acylase